MIGKIINFLKALEVAVPPAPGCHHAITYARYGSDEGGWEDKLALQVGQPSPNGNTFYHCFFLDDEDLFAPVDEVVLKIVIELSKPDPAAQISDTPTRYRPHE